MFTTEQYFSRNTIKRGKNPVYRAGTGLEQGPDMKYRVTHREFSLLIGIAVAIIVIFTLWLKQKPAEADPSSTGMKSVPGMLIKPANVVAKKLQPLLQRTLR